jgi:two-component system, cell cycle response regulator DivK
MHDDEPSRPAPKRVLIVEDNALNLKLLHDVLEAHGYGTLAAGEGAAALDLAQAERPDLILLDLQLPDMSGYEVVNRLKRDERTRAIPVLAVTAFAMKGDEERALDSGCDGYVTKPIRLQEFLDLVRQFLGPPPR